MTMISLAPVNISREKKKNYVLSFLLYAQGWFYRDVAVSKNHFIHIYPFRSACIYKVVYTAK